MYLRVLVVFNVETSILPHQRLTAVHVYAWDDLDEIRLSSSSLLPFHPRCWALALLLSHTPSPVLAAVGLAIVFIVHPFESDSQRAPRRGWAKYHVYNLPRVTMLLSYRTSDNRKTNHKRFFQGLADILPQTDVRSAAKVPKCSQGDILIGWNEMEQWLPQAWPWALSFNPGLCLNLGLFDRPFNLNLPWF